MQHFIQPPSSPRKKYTRNFARGALLLSILLGGAGALAQEKTVQVQSLSVARTYYVQGVIEAVRTARIAPQVAGTVIKQAVQAGDSVHAGQVLLELDGSGAQQTEQAARAQIRAAESELALAQAELQRSQQLYAQNFISKAALQKAQARAQTASAQASASKSQAQAAGSMSSYYSISAPYAGVVSQISANPGDMLMPGQQVISVFDDKKLRITATVAQRLLQNLQPQAQIHWEPALDGLPQSLPLQILPGFDAGSLSGRIKIELPANTSGLMPGTSVKIGLRSAEAGPARLWLPKQSISQRQDMQLVYVLDAAGNNILRQIRTGEQHGELLEILSGLQAGEKVLLDPRRAHAKGAQ